MNVSPLDASVSMFAGTISLYGLDFCCLRNLSRLHFASGRAWRGQWRGFGSSGVVLVTLASRQSLHILKGAQGNLSLEFRE